MKSIKRKANNDIVTSSKRDRNDGEVVMQINFTELRSEINASQSLNKVLLILYTASFHKYTT